MRKVSPRSSKPLSSLAHANTAGQELDEMGRLQSGPDGKSWAERRGSEGAAALTLLLNASLMLLPVDADALDYILQTALFLEVS